LFAQQVQDALLLTPRDLGAAYLVNMESLRATLKALYPSKQLIRDCRAIIKSLLKVENEFSEPS